VDKKDISPTFVPIRDMLADLLTKALCPAILPVVRTYWVWGELELCTQGGVLELVILHS